ncbi:MAG: c-type cytochrome [Pontibacterium sp.]
MLSKTFLSVAIAVVFSVSSQVALAHGGAKGVVKERMDLMDNMKDAMKSLVPVFKGEQTYDAEVVRKAALIIRDHSGDAMTRLFPKGSIKGHSEAKPLIWQEWGRFEGMAKRQLVIGQGLYDAAGNKPSAAGAGNMMGSGSMMGQSAMGSASMMGGSKGADRDSAEHYAAMPADKVFKMLTDNCSSCHTRYRVED